MAVLALLAPWVAVRIPRLRVPVAVVEILLGLFFGRSGLGVLHDTPVLKFLSLFGLSYLMFLSGLEIDLRRVAAGRGRAAGDLLASAAIVLLGSVVGLVSAAWLETRGLTRSPLALAVLLVAGSPTVVLPALKERGYERTRWGQLTLTTTVLADFFSLTGITVVVALATGGSARVLLALLLFLPFVLLLRFARPLQRFWLRKDGDLVTGQIDVRGALAVITVFIALAQALGTATVLGAFLAGLAVSVVLGEAKDALQGKLDALGYGYFVPFFFILLGADVRIGRAPLAGGLPIFVLLLLGVSLAVSFLPSLLLLLRLSSREALAAGILLSTRLSATVAGAAVLAGAGMLRSSTYVAIILMCLCSAVLYPPIAAAVAPAERQGDEDSVLLLGDDQLVAHLAHSLRRQGLRVAASRHVPERLPPAGVLGVFLPKAERDQALEQLLAQRDWRRIVVQAAPDEAGTIRAQGWTPFVPGLAPYAMAEALLRAPLGTAILTGDEAGTLADLPVRNRGLWHRLLREIDLPPGVLVVAVTRGREHIIPRGATRIEPGDVLTVMAAPELLDEVRRRVTE